MKRSAFDPEFQVQSIAGKIVTALERISEAFRVMLWKEGKSLGISPLQAQILIFTLFHEDASKRKVSYLAREFNLAKATISDAVGSLEDKMLIEREADVEDQRSFSARLTHKGQECARQLALFSDQLLQSVECLPKEEQTHLLLHLLQVIRRLHLHGIINIQRMCFLCNHYRPNYEGHTHFCMLLNAPLKESELRLDCPDHQPVYNIQNT